MLVGQPQKGPVIGTKAASTDAEVLQNLPLPNPSLQVTADQQIKLVEAPVYKPKRGEVLLHIKATGICGSVAILTCQSDDS